MREPTPGLDPLIFQFLKFLRFGISNLNGIDLLTVDGDPGLKLNSPTSRFSSDGRYADELTCDGYLLCSRFCLQANAEKR